MDKRVQAQTDLRAACESSNSTAILLADAVLRDAEAVMAFLNLAEAFYPVASISPNPPPQPRFFVGAMTCGSRALPNRVMHPWTLLVASVGA